jgi:hypothetical protein
VQFDRTRIPSEQEIDRRFHKRRKYFSADPIKPLRATPEPGGGMRNPAKSDFGHESTAAKCELHVPAFDARVESTLNNYGVAPPPGCQYFKE